jgi:outer membrane protein
MKLLTLLAISTTLFAQPATLKLTLEEARELALRNHPNLQALSYQAQAAEQIPGQLRSALAPQLSSSSVASAADANTRMAISGLNSPLLFSRAATGLQLSQNLYDFNRTNLQAEAAGLRASGQRQAIRTGRLEVLMAVDRAFYMTLRSRQLVLVAEQTVNARQLIVDQVEALAQSQLRSTLDVSFAKVNLADAQLLATRAKNELDASEADLAAALGLREKPDFDLSDRPLNEILPNDVEDLVSKAIADRPELKQLALELEANQAQLKSEKLLNKPTVTLNGSVGVMPVSQNNFPHTFSAAGVTITIPILNGKLFEQRQAETSLRARAIEKAKQHRENQIARDVRTAYLNARTAYERLKLTGDLLTQSRLALDLAQTRYDLGLSTIVELSTAQLNQTAAEVANTSARYDYQILRSVLKYQLGENPL